MEEEEQVERLWDQREGEPAIWYRIFSFYYLPLGANRSLRNAFELYLRNERPADYDDLNADTFKYIPAHWSEYSRKYEWAKRAQAYEEAKIPDLADVQVNMVLTYLRNNSMAAAKALIDALANPRTAVQASNSVLNRIGVPEVSEVNVKAGITITSDDMAAAREKVESWKITKQSG